MDDIRQTLFDDIAEKSTVARSANSRSKHLNNNKNYHWKELRKMNGKTFTVNMEEPIDFKEFRKLPENLQADYVKYQVEHYGVGQSTLSKMWGVCQSTGWKIFKEYGIKSPVFDKTADAKYIKRANKIRKEKLKATLENIPVVTMSGDKEEPIIPVEVPKTTIEDILKITPADLVGSCIIDTKVEFKSIEDICKFFVRYIPINSKIDIHLEVEGVSEQ